MSGDRTVGLVSKSDELYEWRIPDFFSYWRDAEFGSVQSPTLSALGREYKLDLKIPSREYRHWQFGLVLHFRNIVRDDENETPVSFTPGLKTSGGGAMVEGDTRTENVPKRVHCQRFGSHFAELTYTDLESRRSEFLSSGALTVTCRVRIGNGSAQPEGEAERPTQEPGVRECPHCNNPTIKKEMEKSRSLTKLLDDFKDLLLNEIDTDVIFKVGDKEFKAHRNIIRTRSPVLFAMFAHDTEERRTGVVNIEDCNPDTFSDFLRYVYTGRVEALTERNALHLYRTADKYQMLELKEQCLDLLKGCVSVDNFCDALALSLQHSERELTEIATQFFVDNTLEIARTPRWQTFLLENPTTANELFIKSFQKIR